MTTPLTLRSISQSLLFLAAITTLAITNVVADSASFTETLADKVVCTREDGDTFCDTVRSGTFSLRASLDTDEDIVLADLTSDTPVTIQVGDWSYEGTLGDDPKFITGKSSVMFALVHEQCRETRDGDEICKNVKHGTISIKASKRKITIAIVAKTGTTANDDDLEESPVADLLADDDTIPADATMDAFISIGDLFTSAGTFAITGKVTQKTITKGKGDDAEDFDVSSVSVKGAPVPQP